jgi:hypothetical protein
MKMSLAPSGGAARDFLLLCHCRVGAAIINHLPFMFSTLPNSYSTDCMSRVLAVNQPEAFDGVNDGHAMYMLSFECKKQMQSNSWQNRCDYNLRYATKCNAGLTSLASARPLMKL